MHYIASTRVWLIYILISNYLEFTGFSLSSVNLNSNNAQVCTQICVIWWNPILGTPSDRK
jgi:hypothetical protein